MLRKADPNMTSTVEAHSCTPRRHAGRSQLDSADVYCRDADARRNRRNEFMAQLAKVIDLGRENGIDIAYLNPLYATMKRLSETP
jgi:hypothetical protein